MINNKNRSKTEFSSVMSILYFFIKYHNLFGLIAKNAGDDNFFDKINNDLPILFDFYTLNGNELSHMAGGNEAQ
jgi:hypothetical protein